jgi:glycine dehydrogenase
VCILRQNKRRKLFVSDKVHPQTACVVETRASSLGLEVVQGDVFQADFSSREFAGVLLQYPDTHGSIQDFSALAQNAHANGVRINLH